MKRLPILSCLLLLMCAPVLIFAQTQVSGQITSNTSWTKANSPYHVIGNVVVQTNATLVIEPGVRVFFDPGTRLGVRGTLKAIGADTARIGFSGLDTTSAPGYWDGIIASGDVDFQYVNGRGAKTFLRLYDGGFGLTSIRGCFFARNDTAVFYDGKANDSLRIYRSEFFYNNIGMAADSNTVVSKCFFHDNQKAIWGRRITVFDNRFSWNDIAIISGRSRIVRNRFLNNNLAITEGGSLISLNRFIENGTALETELEEGATITKNGFNMNERAFRIGAGAVFHPSVKIRHNAICNSLVKNVVMAAPSGNTADFRFNCWCESDTTVITGTILDGSTNPALSVVDFTPLDTSDCGIDLVFPGDANHNQIANIFDIFPIGLKYSQTGPVRPNASIFWVGQQAPDWGSTLPNGKDIKHTDCNGDGVINAFDLIPIGLNYGKTHNSLKTGGGLGLPIQLLTPSATVSAGDTINIAVTLGSASAPVKQLYSLGFMMTYDTAMIDPGSIQVNFNNSFLGTEGVDMITLNKDLADIGQYHIGMTRTDQLPVNGFGILADITVVIDDDIMKAEFPLELGFLEAEGMDAGGNEVLVYGESSSVNISTALEAPWPTQWKIYPNPSNGLLQLDWNGNPAERISLTDLFGREMIHAEISSQNMTWDLHAVPNGVYLLQIVQGNMSWSQKLIISR